MTPGRRAGPIADVFRKRVPHLVERMINVVPGVVIALRRQDGQKEKQTDDERPVHHASAI